MSHYMRAYVSDDQRHEKLTFNLDYKSKIDPRLALLATLKAQSPGTTKSGERKAIMESFPKCSTALDMHLKHAVFVLFAWQLVACSTSRVSLNYGPPAGMVAAPQSQAIVAVGHFSDDRGEPSNWLGAIRGGYGNALKKLETNEPVSDLVGQAFAAGLKARGLAAGSSPGRYVLSGSIKQLGCNQVARREANVEIEVFVNESDGAKRVFSKMYRASNVEGSILSPATGVFGSVEDLRALAEKTLQQVVDQALDDAALRSSLHSDARASIP